MRPATFYGFLLIGLTAVAAFPAAAQERAARSVTAQAAPVVPAHMDAELRSERPHSGPRLPEFVASIPLPVEQPAAAPSGNIVIPVTTALIVLAAVVLILLID
jgi:hypothetical protein